ncbi:MAG: metal-dependent hydrolase [Haloferacaceae archaeon]
MLPWGHAGVGYLLYSLYSRTARAEPPDGLPVLALAVGTQFPDLVDKPLAWTLALLPSGRSLAHSVFVAALVVAAIYALLSSRGHAESGRAFALGYASHLAADSLAPIVHGEYGSLTFLLWPLTPPLPDHNRSILEFFLSLELTPLLWFGVALTGVALAVWVADGTPGVGVLRGAANRVRRLAKGTA